MSDFYTPRSLGPLVLLLAACFTLAACMDRSDESVPEDLTDTGIDAEESLEAIPSTESIDFDSAEAGTPTQRHIASSTRRGVVSATPPIKADNYLPPEDAEAFLGTASLTSSSIAGQTPSKHYNSIRYTPTETSDTFGLAIQVWKVEENTSERLEDLRSQFLNVDDPRHSEAPQGSFTSQRVGIRTFVFPAEDDSHIFALSCDRETCLDWTDLFQLGIDIAAR